MRLMRSVCRKNAKVATANQRLMSRPLHQLVAVAARGTMVNKGFQVPNWIPGNCETMPIMEQRLQKSGNSTERD